MPRHPLGLGQFHWLSKLGQQRWVTLPPFAVFLVPGPTTLLGISVGKAGIVLWGNVAQVPHDVHHLVIAEQGLHSPAVFRCLLLQRHEQIHDIARLGAAVQKITHLH